MSSCISCGLSRESLKNEIVVETLNILSAMISTDGPTFEKEVEKFGINSEMVSAIKNIRKINLPAYNLPVAPLPTSTPVQIEHLQKQLSENLATYLQAKEVFEADLKAVQSENIRLKKDMGLMDDDITSLFNKAERQEQYSRRHILEVKGVPTRRGENTNEEVCNIFRAMGVPISRQDICRSHRNGKRRNGHPPIFVKFVRHDVRDKVYMKQDVLREMPGFNRIFIDENLTKYRSHLYREVRKERMWNNWTYDGVIYVSRKGTDPTNCPI